MAHEPLKKPRELPPIPGYRIEGIVGRGATGIVYRARQTSVDRVVALKVLHPELVGSSSASRRMQREARLTAKLAHPNIISAIDMGDLGGQWWYAMELVDGLSLAERIAERPLSEREALRIFIPLCEALQHAFERGVVHRDVKPANILIERGGRALLVDLGLAFAEDDPVLTKSGGTLGTPHYISPEQARDPKGADTQSDLWSLGATMYHAVTGRTPFQGDSVAEILSNVLYARIPDPREQASELSAGFVLVLRKCLTRDKSARYATPAELLADLERLRERRAPKIRAGRLDPLQRRPLTGARLYLAIAGGALALVLAGWAGWHAFRPEPQRAQNAADDPVERLAQACEGPATALSAALAEAERLRASEELPPRARERLVAVESRLVQRLDVELHAFQRDTEAELQRLLGAREFAAAFALADRNPQAELVRRIGARSLPEKQSEDLKQWTRALSERVSRLRGEAEDGFQADLDRYGSEVLIPRVDQLQRSGDWKSARELVARAPEELLADSGVDVRGLDARVLERGKKSLRTRTDLLRKALDEAWGRTDQELVAWIDARTLELQKSLEARASSRAAEALADEFAAEEARRGLNGERLPVGLVHYAIERAVLKQRELAALETRLAEQDSLRLFEELELQAAPAWSTRRYEDVERLFSAQPEGLLRGEAAARARLRAREAHLLTEMLQRAAAKLTASSGTSVELRVGTVPIRGKLEVSGDPLEREFRLVPEGGVARALLLRPRPGATPGTSALAGANQVLAAESVALLAELSPESSIREPRDRLLRALFLFHEAEAGDLPLLESVRGLLDRTNLPADDPLVADLGVRVAAARNQTLDLADQQKRDKARARLNGLRHMVQANGDARTAVNMAEDLLKEQSLWSQEELIELRGMRDSQAERLSAGPLEELSRQLEPTEIADLGAGRVRLRYELARSHGRAFQQGKWILNGAGWAPERLARSEDEFLTRASPTLPLELLKTDKDPLDLRLVVQSPKDVPADQLLVSAAGFHVAFRGARDGKSARCVVDSTSAASALNRIRTGGGSEFAGWGTGVSVELHLLLKRAQGTALVEVDGARVCFESVVAPKEPGPASLVVRAWEGLRLVSVTLEATQR